MRKNFIKFCISKDAYKDLESYAHAYGMNPISFTKSICMDVVNGSWKLNLDYNNTKKIDGNKNTEQISFRVSPKMYKSMKETAHKYDMGVAYFVKLCCLQTIYGIAHPPMRINPYTEAMFNEFKLLLMNNQRLI